MEYVLYDVNDSQVAMVGSFSKQVHDPIITSSFIHLIVNDNQVAYVDIQLGIIF